MAQASSTERPASLDEVVSAFAQQHQVAPALALAVINRESRRNRDAVGDAGKAIGFFQLHEGAAADVGLTPEQRQDPVQNLLGGVKYLRLLNDRYKGDVNKVLQAYNGGMGNVDAGTVSPAAQAYASEILADLSANLRGQVNQPAPVVSPAATPKLPAAATQGMMPPSTMASPRIEQPYETPAERERSLTREVVQQYGPTAAEIASYAIPQLAVTKAAKGLQIANRLVQAGVTARRARLAAAGAEAAMQAPAAAAIALLRGDPAETQAITAAAAPIAGQLVTEMAPAIRQAAVTRMARFMERGVEGDITPEMERSLAQAANDFIDLPLQRTWRQTARVTRAGRMAAQQDLGAAVAGPFGNTPVPIAPIIRGLDDLVADAQHIIPVRVGGQPTGAFRTMTYKGGIPEAVDDLKTLLAEYDTAYNGMVPARELHDIKSVWWKKVYPRKEAAQPVGSTYELLTSAQKEAHLRGAAMIAEVLEQNAPQIASLDRAVTHATRLDQFTKKLANRARKSTLAKREAQYAIGAAGAAVGTGAGGAIGHPIIGAHIGYGTARLLMRAIESPKWRLQPIAMRRRLAAALARGDADRARQILAPLALAATAEEDNLLSPINQSSSASASAAR